jgi:hypothetical protein
VTPIGPPSRRWIPLLSAAILAAPMAQLACILGLAPNAPYGDDWIMLDTTVRLADGTATAGDLTATYCGAHKIALAKLAIAAVSIPTGWDLRAVMVASFGLALATFLILARLALRQTDGTLATWLGLVIGSACLFSLNQFAAFLWGWGIGYTLANAFAVAALVVAAGPTGREPPSGWRWAAAAALCGAASWSNGQGILSWGVMAWLGLTSPGWSARRRVVAAAAWLVAGGAVVAASYGGGFDPAWKPPDEVAVTPARRVAQFLTVTGGLIQAAPPRSVAAGLAVLVAAALPLTDGRVRAPCRPWTALAAYGLAFTAFTAVGRIDAGVGFQFRWSAIVALLMFAVIQLWALWAAAHWPRRSVRAAAVAAGVGVVGVFVLKSVLAVGHIRESWVPRQQMAEVTVAVGGLIPEAAGHEALWDGPPGVPTATSAAYRDRFAALDRLGWRRVRAGFAGGPGSAPRADHWRVAGSATAVSAGWTDASRALVRGTHALFLGDRESRVMLASRYVSPADLAAGSWSATFLVPPGLRRGGDLAVFAYERASGRLVPVAAPGPQVPPNPEPDGSPARDAIHARRDDQGLVRRGLHPGRPEDDGRRGGGEVVQGRGPGGPAPSRGGRRADPDP